MTFFESPHRIAKTLEACGAVFGDRPICVGRELTKIHQEFLRGTASDVASLVRTRARGEFTVVVGPMTDYGRADGLRDAGMAAAIFAQKTKMVGTSRRAAIAETAKELGISAKAVYEAVERAKIGDKPDEG
jgi:16S rRNA (cytidine1402-2'-O)-methyltransferase